MSRHAPSLLALAAVLALCYFGKLVLIILLLSVVFALALEPLVVWLSRAHLPRALGAGMVVALTGVAVLSLCWISYGRAEAFLAQLPSYRNEIRTTVTRLETRAGKLAQTTREVLPEANERTRAVPVKNVDRSLLGSFVSKLGPVGEMLLATSFLPFLSYFMLSWAPHLRGRTVELFAPENRRAAEASLAQIVKMVRKYVVGNLITALMIGALGTIAFGIVSVPFFYFVGFASGLLNLVPYLGLVLALVPPLLVGIGHIHMTGLLVIVATTVVLHLVAINLILPKLVGESLQLNPFAGTFGLLFWAWLWGPMGLLFGIPITAGIKIVCDHVESLKSYGAWLGTPPRQRRREGGLQFVIFL
jgi:predicted PurR-regulated permease PerM